MAQQLPLLKRRPARILLALAAVWLAFDAALALVVHAYGQTERAQSADVLILLGPPVERRVAKTAALYQQGIAPCVLCTGGQDAGDTTLQAFACRDRLVARGVSADAILLETASVSTEENALFALPILQARGWRTIVLVTDSNHLLRAHWRFARLGLTVYDSPAAPDTRDPLPYAVALLREVVALQWQAVVDLTGLPITQVSGG